MDNFNFYKYLNEKSILVINQQGKIKRLYCPFPVVDKMRKISTVSAVASDNDDKTYYNINGTYILYSYYEILLN